MLFFADSGERVIVQAVMMGSVVAVITTSLLLLRFLDSPFERGFGGLRPVAMERTLETLAQEMRVVRLNGPLPCDEQGVPRSS
jgi:hypothetical protein